MNGTESLISKWTAQMIAFREKADTLPPGPERDDFQRRADLCRRAIDTTETITLTHFASRIGPQAMKGNAIDD